MTQYLIYDVFTETVFGGNPLAVIPDATGLNEGDLQKIAAEFNLSETTFVSPPTDPAADARVRIFNPINEMPFAGHPTVGTAIALRDLGLVNHQMTLELKVGLIPVVADGGSAQFETKVPLETRAGVTTQRMADMVGLPINSISVSAHPPINASVGADFLLAELADDEALAQCSPNLSMFREEADSGTLDIGAMVYVRHGQALNARMFAPTQGIPEDPATGSAAAALTALLGKLDGRTQTFTINQGVLMGRPSKISSGVTVEASLPVAVTIGGRAVKVMEGRLTI